MMSPAKKVIVVSGATSSLGSAICKRLVNEGFAVAPLSRSSPDFPCDIRIPEDCDRQIKRIVENVGTVYGLVNCAGINIDRLLVRSTPIDFSTLFETNVIGAMNLSKSCLKHGGMLKERNGSILSIGSVVGIFGNSGQTAYAASKAGLIGASLSLAKEYSSANIRCNVLCPGLIQGTSMCNALSDAQIKQFTERSLLKRCATLEEVSDAAFFLINNTYVNGQTIALDGGH